MDIDAADLLNMLLIKALYQDLLTEVLLAHDDGEVLIWLVSLIEVCVRNTGV